VKKIVIGLMILLSITSISSQEPAGRNEELERVKQVQARHEKELMKLPGVVGVGIGSDAGRLVLQVLVDQTARKKPKLPAEIEGIPVKVVPTGKIVAHPTNKKGGKTRGSRCPRGYQTF
jgi:hypothetical protein